MAAVIHNIQTALPGKKMPGRVGARTGQKDRHVKYAPSGRAPQ
jgi:hypothetical protein